LIEVIAVVAILAILIGLVAYGMTKVMGNAKERQTRVTLENLKAMLNEYKVVSKGLTRQPANNQMWYNGSLTPKGGIIDIWKDGDPNTDNYEPDGVKAPGDVSLDTLSATNTEGRYNADQILNTQLVMGLLSSVPSVKTMLSQMPSSQFMETIPANANAKLRVQKQSGGEDDYGNVGGPAKPSPVLVLDGRGNPILFVPAGGLWDVTAGDVKHLAQPTSISPLSNDGPLRSPDNLPFWVSAGPDGNFKSGDDNLYSFEQ
jgi:type II secretory pathway pseudopilin PulG